MVTISVLEPHKYSKLEEQFSRFGHPVDFDQDTKQPISIAAAQALLTHTEELGNKEKRQFTNDLTNAYYEDKFEIADGAQHMISSLLTPCNAPSDYYIRGVKVAKQQLNRLFLMCNKFVTPKISAKFFSVLSTLSEASIVMFDKAARDEFVLKKASIIGGSIPPKDLKKYQKEIRELANYIAHVITTDRQFEGMLTSFLVFSLKKKQEELNEKKYEQKSILREEYGLKIRLAKDHLQEDMQRLSEINVLKQELSGQIYTIQQEIYTMNQSLSGIISSIHQSNMNTISGIR